MRAESEQLHVDFVIDQTGNERFWAVPCGNTRAFSWKNRVFPPIKHAQTRSFPPGLWQCLRLPACTVWNTSASVCTTNDRLTCKCKVYAILVSCSSVLGYNFGQSSANSIGTIAT